MGNSGWFIYCLFFIYVINKAFYKYRLPLASVLFVIAGIGLVKTTQFTLDRIIYYDLFFVLGTYLRSCYNRVETILKTKGELVIIAGISLYGIMMYSFPQSFIINSFLLPIFAITAIWSIVFLMMTSTEFDVMKYFGKYSLQFYLNQICLLPLYYAGLIVFNHLHSYQITFFAIFLLAVLVTFIMLVIENKTGKFKVLFGL